jgi:hypothetical protein
VIWLGLVGFALVGHVLPSVGFAAASISTQATPTPPRVFLLDGNHLAATRQRIHEGDTNFAPALVHLKHDADQALEFKPVSVMDKPTTPPSGDKHDYMSQAPYFWPDPKSSNGLPYIRRDGEHNPEIRTIPDHKNILEMPETVETLALEWYFSGDERYAAKAAQLLRVWFLDSATRMNPNLEFAQAVPGVNTGRGAGLIESRNLTKVVDAAGLLAGSKAWTENDQRGLKQWFAAFLRWLQDSKSGRAEAAAKNNHGTYYDTQITSFFLFLGKMDLAKQVVQNAREKRIALQIEPDGRQPLELARTRAWSYSIANLSGLMSLAVLGDNVGVDLWNYQTTDGRSLRRALDFLLPFALGEKKWSYQQLGGWSPAGFFPLLRRAAPKISEPRYRDLASQYAPLNPSDRTVLLHAF